MIRASQSGSILGFVVVGGVLAVLLVGSAYFVRRNFASVSEPNPVVVEDEGSSPEENTSEPEEGTGTDDEGADTESEQTNSTTASPESEAEEPQPQQSPTPSQSESGSASPDNLPETGPADALFNSILIGGLVAAAIAYKRSRDASVSL